jgi:TolB-like protein/Flp pilus assembly protein TadD
MKPILSQCSGKGYFVLLDLMTTTLIDLSGRTLGHYRLTDKIGSGGMGIVYAASDTHLDRSVAVKVLPAGAVADPERRQRFVQEATSASALNHPNIIHIYDIDRSEDVDYMAMELVSGRALDEVIGRKGLSIGETLKVAVQIADALAAAHAAGIIHRDLKPANVMVTDKGLVKVLDFGLAKLIESAPGPEAAAATRTQQPLTGEGVVMGTSAYMSPEQAEGKKVDARSDIFAFGSVLYEMVTGRRAFQGESTIGTLSAILHKEPQPPEDVPPEFERILTRCLRKDPERRFQNMADVRVALEELKDESDSGKLSPLSSRQAGVRARTRAKSRLPIVLASAALMVFVVLWGTGVFRPQSVGRPAAPAPIRSIAVLPLEYLGGGPDQDYFADGMTDAIIAELGKINGFERVISWQSMKRYKKSTKSAAEIAAEVNVDVLVEGTVLREGNRVRISPRLIRPQPEKQLWAETYERDLREIMSLQSEMARTIAREVNVAVSGTASGTPDAAPKVDPGAYTDYLRGNHYLERNMEEVSVRTAIQQFEKATSADSSFADAYAQLAYAHALLWYNYFDRTLNRREAALSAARRALELRPDSAKAHIAMAWVYFYGYLDYTRALDEISIAKRYSPHDSQILNATANIKRRQGQWLDAAKVWEQMIASDPNSAAPVFALAATYSLMRRYNEAEPLFKRAIALDSAGQYYAREAWFAMLSGRLDLARSILQDAKDRAVQYHQLPYYRYQLGLYTGDFAAAEAGLSSDASLSFEWQWFFVPKSLLHGQIMAFTGRAAEARQDFEASRRVLEAKVRDQPDDDRFYGSLGIALARLGFKKEAIEAGRKGMELCPMSKEAWRATFRIEEMARIYALVGEYDLAVRELDTILSVPAEVSTAVLLLDPLWAALKSHQGFQDLIKKYGR